MEFVPFELERWQCTWENRVRINLSESGVHPLTVRELVDLAGIDFADLERVRLGYNQSDGTVGLRREIAALYPGTTEENVIVTVGSSEANFITCWTLLEPGDRVVILAPLYRQTWGLSQNFRAQLLTFDLKEEAGWEPDLDEVTSVITPDTKLVVITNPNNPTGHRLSEEARSQIIDRVRAAGAWLLADEVYQGAELDRRTTASFWGSYDRAVVVNGLSKAYGLPGLRIGWAVGPEEFKQAVYRRHDYTVIGPATQSDFLATKALQARDHILSRTRKILNENYPVLSSWLETFGDAMVWQTPDCGAICFPRLTPVSDTMDLADKVRQECDILIEPGEHFGLPGFIRFGYGNETGELAEALEILKPVFEKYLY
jgi:aspartate/methionine/tyrosine aminotransferase